MCTTIALYDEKSMFFGRNMDIEYDYSLGIVITPRNFALGFRKCPPQNHHYSIIGMAAVSDNYPLYADAVNEYSLAGAGLNFPQNAYYSQQNILGQYNVSPFELIPFVLSQCKNLVEAKALLSQINLVDINFSDKLKNTPLHWHFADNSGSIVFEATKNGCKVYDNPLNVLTNNPPFEYHLQNYGLYSNLSASEKSYDEKTLPSSATKGLGAFGLPGDYSSQSRFVKAAFLLENSKTVSSSVAQTFNILSALQVVNGSINLGENIDYHTRYMACMDAQNVVYYCKKYDDLAIKAYDLNQFNQNDKALIIA